MDNAVIETKLRNFLADELMKRHALTISLSDPLDLDSLDLTEIHVFLEEEFGFLFSGESFGGDTLNHFIQLCSVATTGEEKHANNIA